MRHVHVIDHRDRDEPLEAPSCPRCGEVGRLGSFALAQVIGLATWDPGGWSAEPNGLELLPESAFLTPTRSGYEQSVFWQKVINDRGVPGRQALEIIVTKIPPKTWDCQVVYPLVGELPVSGPMQLGVWLQGKSPGARARIKVQEGKAPWTMLIQRELRLEPTWTRYQESFDADPQIPVNRLQFSIDLGFSKQTVRIGPIQITTGAIEVDDVAAAPQTAVAPMGRLSPPQAKSSGPSTGKSDNLLGDLINDSEMDLRIVFPKAAPDGRIRSITKAVLAFDQPSSVAWNNIGSFRLLGDIEKGQRYHLSLALRTLAHVDEPIIAKLQQGIAPFAACFQRSIVLDSQWKTYAYDFIAAFPLKSQHDKLSIMIGGKPKSIALGLCILRKIAP